MTYPPMLLALVLPLAALLGPWFYDRRRRADGQV